MCLLRSIAAVAGIMLAVHPAIATQTERLEGRVLDHNSIALPGVTITVVGPVERAVFSGVDGKYRLPGLPPGPYRVAAAMPGFATLEHDIELSGDEPYVLDFQMQQAFEETVVVSASRSGVALQDTPTTISVIDEETIETSAARNVGDLLRSVPGVNVIQSSARDINVATRHSGGLLTSSQLAMVDGRPLFFDFFNLVFWDLLSVSIPNVQQIEVVRGPASAMWGANAATGVVNVVTKPPRDSQGLQFLVSGGVMSRSEDAGGTGGLGSVAFSWTDAVSDKVAYRISAGYAATDPFERPTGNLPIIETPIGPPVTVGGGSYDDIVYENQGTKQPKFDLRVDQEIRGDGRITYSAGYAGTQGILHSPIGPFDLTDDTQLGYGQISYTRGGFHASVFANHISGSAPNLVTLTGDGEPLVIEDFSNGVYNLDLGWRGLYFNNHLMTFGGNFRINTFDLSIAPDADTNQQVGLYAQDEINLGRVGLALALRADDFENVDGVIYSPSLAVIWTPSVGHSFKASYNRGFRTPSAVDNFLDISVIGGYFPVSEFDPRLEEDFPIVIGTIGNPDLRPETIDAFEIGYSLLLNHGATRFDLNIYQSETRDTISNNPSAEALELAGIDPYYTAENPPPGWPLHPIVIDFLAQSGIQFPTVKQFLNIGDIRNRGIEVSASQFFRGGWSVYANYSYQAEPELLNPVGDPYRPLSDTVSVPPAHRFNLGFNYNGPEYLGGLTINYSDRAYFGEGLDPTYLGYSDAYTLVGLTFGRKWNEGRITTSIKVMNALDERALQHVFGDILRRSVVLELQFRY
jgi:outer membrane receptor protein involved in Fe transport